MRMLLAGDIGGTKTTLALFSPDDGPRKPVAEATYPSARYPSLEAVVHEFVRANPQPIERASFGVAGPVVGGQATITNLPWVMDEQRLCDALQVPVVRLLNDLTAIAHAVPLLEDTDVRTLRVGQAAATGAIAVIAPGTGLGEAFLTWDGARYHAHGSEGGHTDFAPSSALELDLLRYLFERLDHVSFERVCSGIGLPNLYRFLSDRGVAVELPEIAQEIAGASDITPIIVKSAMSATPSPLCTATLNLFVSILGAEAGNLALKVLATGGVYLGGGIPPRILPALAQPEFLQAFDHKGRFKKLLDKVPVHVILNPKVALLGAASHGLETTADE